MPINYFICVARRNDHELCIYMTMIQALLLSPTADLGESLTQLAKTRKTASKNKREPVLQIVPRHDPDMLPPLLTCLKACA